MRYLAPKRSSNAFNTAAKWLTARGISLMGSRVLAVRGRKSGEVRSTVVNLFTYEGDRYLLAPRGHTQWVRNLRAVGEGELRLGRRSERFTPVEIADADKTPLIRLYLRKWAWETGGANALYRRGWRKEDLMAGTMLVIDGYQARNGSKTANATSITFENGKRLFAASSSQGGASGSK